MLLETPNRFVDFELLDTGLGNRLERWGQNILVRPDPQVIWPRHLAATEWDAAHAIFQTKDDKGHWEKRSGFPASWFIRWQETLLVAKLSPFKHTGIFAEQAANWEWMLNQANKARRQLNILNLFGYTGAATVILAKQRHFVTHVDASKQAIAWAKENRTANNLPPDSIRWILDDAAKFVQRERKRGSRYDAILLDPPAFGHSPTGKTWKFNRDLPALLADCVALLSDDPRFLLLNGYATNSSAIALNNILEDAMSPLKGKIEFGELCLQQKDARLISTGIFARWSH